MKLTITGSVPSKKNSRQNFARGNRLMSVPNAAYLKWEREALRELAGQAKALKLKPITEYPVKLTCTFYVKDRTHRDLDNMLASVLDVLKDHTKKGEILRKGIITDDSWHYIRPIVLAVGNAAEMDDPKYRELNPRVELDIEPIV